MNDKSVAKTANIQLFMLLLMYVTKSNTVLTICLKNLLTQKMRGRGAYTVAIRPHYHPRLIREMAPHSGDNTRQKTSRGENLVTSDDGRRHETRARQSHGDQHLAEIRVFVNLSASCLR